MHYATFNLGYQVIKTFLISKLQACELRVKKSYELQSYQKRLVSQVQSVQDCPIFGIYS